MTEKELLLEESRYARATVDSTFKMVMHNPRVRLAIVRDFTGRQDIVSSESTSTALPQLRLSGRTQRDQDFVCTFEDGSKCLLELQVTKQNGWNNRAIFHAAYTFVDQLKKGNGWDTIYPVIAINFLNFKTGLLKEPEAFENRFMLVDTLNPTVVLPQVDMRFLELPSVPLLTLGTDCRKPWLEIFKESHKMKEIPTHFNEIQEEMMTMLEMRDWTEAFTEEYLKKNPDWSKYSEVFAEGRQEARIEGRTEGFQEGVDLGKAEGKAEGFIEGMKAMARKMLMRNHSLQEISEDTGLSENEILQLVQV